MQSNNNVAFLPGRLRGCGAAIRAVLVSLLLLLLLLLCCRIPAPVLADTGAPPGGAGAAEPHPHSGVVAPFKSGDPGVTLNAEALSILQSGQPYKTQIQAGTGGRGLVVQDVMAPTSVVWDRILDFHAYPKMVPKTVESEVYRREALPKHQQRIWVRMKIGFPVLKLQFYVNHLYDPAKNSLTWTLDYSVKSDLDDSCGYWYVVPHPDNPTMWSRVYYSVEVSMFSWVPQFVVDFMSKQALVDATAWVKKHSELKAGTAGTAATPASSAMNEKRRERGGGRFALPWQRWDNGRGAAKDQRGAAAGVGGSAATAATPSEADSVAAASEKQQRIGLTRYALVSTVLALSFYNVHLYLSH